MDKIAPSGEFKFQEVTRYIQRYAALAQEMRLVRTAVPEKLENLAKIQVILSNYF